MTGITILAFIAGAALVFGFNLLYADIQRARWQNLQEQIQREQQLVQRERAQIAMAHRELYELAALPAANRAKRKSFREQFGLYFEQSGVLLQPVQVIVMVALATLVAAGGAWLLTGIWFIAVLAALAGGALPCFYVIKSRRRRLQRLLQQLPEAFDLISRMMRAGRTFPQAMQVAVTDGSRPLSEEFGYCCDQQQLGMTSEAALRDLARRTGLLELRIFVMAVSIHRQSGGNLADLLEKLADVIRDRQRIRGLISSLTAEGRFQLYTLTALPLLTFICMSLFARDYAQELYDRPALLAVTAGMMVVGWSWMKKIVNFDY